MKLTHSLAMSLFKRSEVIFKLHRGLLDAVMQLFDHSLSLLMEPLSALLPLLFHLTHRVIKAPRDLLAVLMVLFHPPFELSP